MGKQEMYIKSPDEEDVIEDELDNPTGLDAPTLANMNKALASYPVDEVGERSSDSALEEAIVRKTPLEEKLSTLGTAEDHEVVDIVALTGGNIGYEEMGPVGSLLGASMGGVLARSLANKQSGESEALTKYGVILRGMSDKEGNAVLTFEDGTVLPIPTDPNQEVDSGLDILTGKASRKASDIDKTSPVALKTSKKTMPLSKHIVENIYGFDSKQSKYNTKVLNYVNGALTSALVSDGATNDIIDSRVKELMLKLGMVRKK